MYTTRVLADYVSEFRADALTPDAREAALRCVFDLITATLAGYHAPAAEGTRRVARALYCDGAAAVWFSGDSMAAIGAAYCNSAAASVLDLDDGNRLARGHPGASVIPAAFATAAETGATDMELLAAIAIGYEVGVSIGAARGYYARSGMWCGYGAVAATGWLRRTRPEQLSHALAMAGISAPNLLVTSGDIPYPAPVGNDIKEGIPWATATSMTALQLAEAGLAGPEDILDHAPHFAVDRITDDLGGTPAICNTYFKPYAGCRHLHAPIDAFETLMTRHAFSPREIESIEVHTYSGALKPSNRCEPANLVDVQYSIPYCIGLTAVIGSTAMLPLDDTVLNRPDAVEIARKVSLRLDPELDSRFPAETPTRVVVTTAAGRFESPVTTPAGDPANPMSWSDLRDKFRAATRNVATTRQQHEVLDAVDRLGEGDLDPLIRILGQPIAA